MKNLKIMNKIILDFGHFKEEVDINIKGLYLSNSNLAILPDSISNLSQLKKLWLDNNNFSQQEKDKIKKLLPNTIIYF